MIAGDNLVQLFKEEFEDGKFYCQEWFSSLSIQTFMLYISPLVVSIINVLVCYVYEWITTLEGHLTRND